MDASVLRALDRTAQLSEWILDTGPEKAAAVLKDFVCKGAVFDFLFVFLPDKWRASPIGAPQTDPAFLDLQFAGVRCRRTRSSQLQAPMSPALCQTA
jgi:hypothetical protein